MRLFSAMWFVLLLLLRPTFCYSTRQQMKLREMDAKLQNFQKQHLPALLQDVPETKQSGRVLYPIGYGADPSGREESSDAMLNALDDAFKMGNGLEMVAGVNDLGGVVVDLQGGNYKISKPLRFPAEGGGNIVVKGGTLRASDTFPDDRHLIEIWSPNSKLLDKKDSTHSDGFSDDIKDQSVGIYYEDITFSDILFDSKFKGGGLLIIDSVRIRIHNCFFLHFNTEGILIQRGHETFISSCFLGQHSTVGGDKDEKDFSATAIDVAGNDNAITDVAIFSAAIGVVLRGQANILTGIHCYNKATYWGGIGILVKQNAALTRIDNCYLDYNSIVMEDPIQVHVTNGLFLGDGNLVLKSINGKISGLNIINNMFNGNPKNMIPMVKIEGLFSNIDQVVIDHNNVNGMSLKSSVGRLTIGGNNKNGSNKWVADFSSVLVFPNKINHFQYSFYYIGGDHQVGHRVTNVSNNVVVVESDKEVNGMVSVVVDQFNLIGEDSIFM
ncbi:polygalacturonase QRT3 isoform X2 [Mercurialis annua]|uniref:polygalacturonase QRT3 isoform X2 n=1 Tax=Mercurialis annua TaxID=3986 RepID=UPI00215E83D3|nr:polygalacturonase QRT3 isoform X2 [Mercurialis annua]